MTQRFHAKEKKFLFTFDLLFFFIIPQSQRDELRGRFVNLQESRNVFHPLLLCLRTLILSKFFENIEASGRFPKFFKPLKYPILLFTRKTPC